MKNFAIPLVCLMLFAACGASPKGDTAATAPKKAEPRTAQVGESQRVPVPDAWTEEVDSDSVLLGTPCTLRLVSPVADTEICISVNPTETDPFQELPPEILGMIKEKLESDGWTDVAITYDASRKMFGIAGTRNLDLKQDGKEARWRVRFLRADLPGDPGQALMLLAVTPAENAAKLDAAVDAIAGSIKAPAPEQPAP